MHARGSGAHRAAAQGARGAHAATEGPSRRRLPLEALVAATTVAFAAGSVSGAAFVSGERQETRARVEAVELRERVDRAATVRLTAGATRYAAARQEQALVAARAALADAEAVLATAPALVGEATVAPLDEAVTELSALVAALEPPLPDIAEGAVAAVADADPADERETDAAAPLAAAPAEPPAPVVPAPDDSPVATALALTGAPTEVLDLETSAAILAAAHRVAALSVQVGALSETLEAELAAAAEAAEARRAEEEARRIAAEQAALQAALRRMSTRIAATDAAPNGAIPVELLCRPRFAKVLLRCDAAQALERLNEAYRAAFGQNLAVSGGYRTLAEQESARATRGDLAALPGTSMHGRALAVDFSGFGSVGQFDDPDYLWMVENGPAFGWVHPPSMGPGGSGPLEPWHWEYVG